MFGIEEELFKQMVFLKELYALEAVKAEFEAEGSSFNDLVRLRRLTEKAGVRLFLKIGGVEAVRDIKDSLELGVDGLIAPMVESAFGLRKFLDAYASVYRGHRIRLAINIETRGAIAQLGDILDMATRAVDGVTLGRKDLSASYLDDSVEPDCPLVDGLVVCVGGRLEDARTGLHRRRRALRENYRALRRHAGSPFDRRLSRDEEGRPAREDHA